MLTALHITIPRKNENIGSGSKPSLPNRCLVVNDTTNEVTLTSTEAALKHSVSEKNSKEKLPPSGTRFRFDHITVSPHHGSIFVTQVAPMLYDLCCSFLAKDGASQMESNSTISKEPNLSMSSTRLRLRRRVQSMSRTVFLYGSTSTTERRALFLHLAKASTQAILQQTGVSHSAASPTASSRARSAEVSFSLVDLYHSWGVGDVLDPNHAMHDATRLERMRRQQPRWSLNEPKGISFVEPTRQLLERRDSAAAAVLRAIQRAEPPRGLRSSTEKEDHDIKSSLVLTFYISRKKSQRLSHALKDGSAFSTLPEFSQQELSAVDTEARLHLVLLPDSSAAVHGKQIAQELSALATALQACAQRRHAMAEEGFDALDVSCESVECGKERSMSMSKNANANLPWTPLRESPLLLYVFESEMYYIRKEERSLREWRREQRRQEQERLESFDVSNRSVSPNTSISSRSRSGRPYTRSATERSAGAWIPAAADAVQCIDSGIGRCLLIVCVNSAWDQYYQARSAFLFAQRSTNQLGLLSKLGNASMEGAKKVCDGETVQTRMRSDLKALRVTNLNGDTITHIRSPCHHLADDAIIRSSIPIPSANGADWSSPRWNDRTQPRHGSLTGVENSPASLTRGMPSDVSPADGDDLGYDSAMDVSGQHLSPQSSHAVQHRQVRMLLSRETNEEENNEEETDAGENGKETETPFTRRPTQREASSIHKSARQLFAEERLPITQHTHYIQQPEQQKRQKMSPHPVKKEEHQKKEQLAPQQLPSAMISKQIQKPNKDTNEMTSQNESVPRLITSHRHPYAPADDGMMHSLHVTRSPHSAPYQPLHPSIGASANDDPTGAETLRVALEHNAVMNAENDRLRARLAQLSLQQAETYGEASSRAVGLSDVCDAALLNARHAAHAERLCALQEDLAAATRRAQVLEKSLARSLSSNRQLRHQLKHSLVELPRALREAMRDNKGEAHPGVTEERMRQWESMLQQTAQRLISLAEKTTPHGSTSQTRVCDGVGAEDEEEDIDGEDTEEFTDRPFDGTGLVGFLPQSLPARVASHRTNTVRQGGRTSRAVQAGDQTHSSPIHVVEVDPQLTALLHLGERLFLSPLPTQTEFIEHTHHSDKRGESPHREGLKKAKMTESVLEIFGSHSKHTVTTTEKQRGKEEEKRFFGTSGLCWKCHADRRTRHQVDYVEFLRLLRTLCDRTKLTQDSSRLYNATQPPPSVVYAENASLQRARRVSMDIQLRTESEHPLRTALNQKETELEHERERRRQLQDELLRLRLLLSKYEAKLTFIDETVKPKISSDIVELERAESVRKHRQISEREQRAAIMSEILKRLERVTTETESRQHIHSGRQSFFR